MAPRPCLLLQLCAAAAASCLLAAICPVDAAPPPSRDASATTVDTDAPRSVANDGVADAGVSRGARRLGPPHHRLRVLSDIVLADAPAFGMPADAPAEAADQSMWTAVKVALGILILFFGAYVVAFLVVVIVKAAAMLASAVADLYAAAKTAHEKATRVRPLSQDAVDAAGGH